MPLFRQHRGGLAESLATTREVNSLNELHQTLYPEGELKCEYYGTDDRLPEWHSTYIVEFKPKGAPGFYPVGFSNGPLDWVPQDTAISPDAPPNPVFYKQTL